MLRKTDARIVKRISQTDIRCADFETDLFDEGFGLVSKGVKYPLFVAEDDTERFNLFQREIPEIGCFIAET